MKLLLLQIVNQLFYVGYDKETVNRLRPRIYESNRHTMKMYCPLATLTMGALSLGALFSPYMEAFLPCYVGGFVCTILSSVLLFMSERRSHLLNLSIVILIASMLLFGVLLGTIYDPHNTAATYVALIFAIPLLFCLRPLYTLFSLLINDAMFAYLCATYKDEAIIYNDLLNIVSFSAVSFLVSLLITKTRMRQFALEEQLVETQENLHQRNLELEHMCSNDIMTDLGNYFSYLHLAQNYSIMSEDTYTGVIFADLNHLKYINDHQGHEAGNAYITSFAQKLKQSFAHCECFRLSGDEFLVVGLGQDPEDFNRRAAEFKAAINADPIPVSAIGYLCEKSDDLDKLKQKAEAKMYEDKLEFYQRFPEFKR